MFGYMLEEKVDKDFRLARRRALLGRIGVRLRRGFPSDGLLCFEEFRKLSGATVGRVYRGLRSVPVGRIRGSVGRCSEFDRGFMPARTSAEERWKGVDRAFRKCEELPPVALYEIGGLYFVLDGHHRVSVASYHGVEWIDAEVTEFRVRSPKARQRTPRRIIRKMRNEGERSDGFRDLEAPSPRDGTPSGARQRGEGSVPLSRAARQGDRRIDSKTRRPEFEDPS
jgi:hypothetical protein